ncbi:MAG: rRNA-binding ribosome biosynthesis protein rpf2 [Trichoglossum hirsutum]|nr:MAG: rRNA-binding ribosome biosynthesis protein rpf2 [Trichoglossum hirsutum]
MLRQIKPRNARSKRALEKKEPKLIENPKTCLFLRGTTASEIVQYAITDLHSLKKPNSVKFTKKNAIHPFEDATSLEFFSQKNDASLMVFGSHSKKRPHNLTLIRMFDHHVLDMIELFLDPTSFRTLTQFKNNKCAVGQKPLLLFAGSVFDENTTSRGPYALLKSFFVDFFGGGPDSYVDVEGLRYMVSIAVGEPSDEEPQPKAHFRVYLIQTRRSGQKLPRVEIEEMGPRMDFRIGRVKEAEESVMKEALKKPRQLEPKTKKNVETDIVGDKLGRIHVGKQDLGKLQTRKMKGLKRGRDAEAQDEDITMIDGDSDSEPKRPKRS